MYATHPHVHYNNVTGSTEAGPRCDEDAVFISHSILGTVEEYLEADRSVSERIQLLSLTFS